MKEHVIRTWCDACPEGEREEAVTHHVAIDSQRSEVDLCERHVKQLLEPLALLVGDLRVEPPPPALAPGNRRRGAYTSCPLCGLKVVKDAVVSHVWVTHVRGVRPARPLVCPECGKQFGTTNGCGAHRSQAHGYTALAEAVAAARAAGA